MDANTIAQHLRSIENGDSPTPILAMLESETQNSSTANERFIDDTIDLSANYTDIIGIVEKWTIARDCIRRA